MKNPHAILGLILITTLSGPLGFADIIVQWGEAGGQGSIVSAQQNSGVISNVYTPSTAINPASDYYATSTGRTPVFNGAYGGVLGTGRYGGGANELAVFNNWGGANSDAIAVGKNTGTSGNPDVNEVMIVWESANFLDLSGSIPGSFALNTINMEGRLRSSHGAGDLAEYRYLLQDSSGAFHVSQAFSDITTTTYSATISRSAGDLSWFAYTPFGMDGNAAGDDTIGAASSPSLIDFSGIGLVTATEDDDQNWAEHNTRFFQVDVVAAVPEPSVLVLLALGLTGLVLFRRCPLRF